MQGIFQAMVLKPGKYVFGLLIEIRAHDQRPPGPLNPPEDIAKHLMGN